MKYEKSPFGATWEAISEDGVYIERLLQPDDILADIAQGATVSSLMVHYNAPRAVVEHCIAEIPRLLAWRESRSRAA